MMSSRRDSHLISLTSHVDTLPPSDHEVLADTGDGHPLPPGHVHHHHHDHGHPHHGVTCVSWYHPVRSIIHVLSVLCPWHSFSLRSSLIMSPVWGWGVHTLHWLLITFVPTPVIIKASTGSGTRLFYTPRIYINALYGFTHHHNSGSEYVYCLCNKCTVCIFTGSALWSLLW